MARRPQPQQVIHARQAETAQQRREILAACDWLRGHVDAVGGIADSVVDARFGVPDAGIEHELALERLDRARVEIGADLLKVQVLQLGADRIMLEAALGAARLDSQVLAEGYTDEMIEKARLEVGRPGRLPTKRRDLEHRIEADLHRKSELDRLNLPDRDAARRLGVDTAEVRRVRLLPPDLLQQLIDSPRRFAGRYRDQDGRPADHRILHDAAVFLKDRVVLT